MQKMHSTVAVRPSKRTPLLSTFAPQVGMVVSQAVPSFFASPIGSLSRLTAAPTTAVLSSRQPPAGPKPHIQLPRRGLYPLTSRRETYDSLQTDSFPRSPTSSFHQWTVSLGPRRICPSASRTTSARASVTRVSWGNSRIHSRLTINHSYHGRSVHIGLLTGRRR